LQLTGHPSRCPRESAAGRSARGPSPALYPPSDPPSATAEKAAERRFGGTDADGGISDWYLSNGIVELIVDDAALQDDLPPGVVAPPKQSENALTGGTIIDLGLVGADNPPAEPWTTDTSRVVRFVGARDPLPGV
jgi:hypothetical protein